MVVSTYQAASGAGAAAMEELELQTREVFFLHFIVVLQFDIYFHGKLINPSPGYLF